MQLHSLPTLPVEQSPLTLNKGINMASLVNDFRLLARRNRDGSRATQENRLKSLELFSKQLKELGFNQMRANKVKLKHVNKLVEYWQEQGLSSGTIKNRMSHIRWLSEKINKPHMIPAKNDYFDIARRKYVTNENKAISNPYEIIKKIDNKNIELSLRLQKEFGLRREESLKFNPSYADKGNGITLKSSWCKGGRPREIPVRNEAQRALLDEIKRVVGNGSLIPKNKSYIEHLNAYNYALRCQKISKTHGLRHYYAQERYRELTGFDCPACGGKTSRELDSSERLDDTRAREIISAELGHARESITAIYLGR